MRNDSSKHIRADAGKQDFSILGVGFRLVAGPEVRAYIDAFLGAYGSVPNVAEGSPVFTITVHHKMVRMPVGSEPVIVHVSPSQSYWNVCGSVVQTSTGRLVAWMDRGVVMDIDYAQSTLDVFADPSLGAARAGEAAFHCCRSLSLCMRNGRLGNLLHASAISVAGRAILFCGEELSGKSTMFAVSILETEAAPLASDRVLATSDRLPLGISWPGYVSFCEGTLLDFPRLADGALRYEQSPPPPWRTQSWPNPLQPIYNKTRKRMYPMAWLAELVGRHFVREAPIGALVLPRVSPDVDRAGFEQLDPDDPQWLPTSTEVIDRNRFDLHEPAFLAWHGFRRPSGFPHPVNLARRLKASGVEVWRCRVRPPDFSPARELILELGQRMGS